MKSGRLERFSIPNTTHRDKLFNFALSVANLYSSMFKDEIKLAVTKWDDEIVVEIQSIDFGGDSVELAFHIEEHETHNLYDIILYKMADRSPIHIWFDETVEFHGTVIFFEKTTTLIIDKLKEIDDSLSKNVS